MRRAALLLALGACSSARVSFPARDPLVLDTDLHPVSVPCRPDPAPDDPEAVVCAPREYVSPFIWDKVDNTAFERASRWLAVDVADEAVNVNSLDEVPDSAWFTNRVTHRASAPTALGACAPEDLLPAAADVPDGAWVIDRGKGDGATLGFRVHLQDRGKYMLKVDEVLQPERASAASTIGAALYYAIGFNTSCEQVVYVRREQLKLEPGLTVETNLGVVSPFDAHHLDATLATAPRRGPLFRLQASKWLPGQSAGPFRYEGIRADDPNDVIPHEDRRELRGSKLLAAWINHWDAREQNTLDSWIAVDPDKPWSSPGYLKHQIIDTSDAMGQRAPQRGLAPRQGFSYLFDFHDIFFDLFTLGAVRRPWDGAHLVPGHEHFGYFASARFEPEAWKSGYPNPAFLRMTERDAAWMARLIARFSPDDVRAFVELGQLSDPGDATYLTAVLLERQRRILARYLTRLSPLGEIAVADDGRICATDLARLRGIEPATSYHYDAVEVTARPARSLAVTIEPAGRVCIARPAGGGDDASTEIVIRVRNGTRAGALELHAYAIPGSAKLRVVGLRRL